MGLRDVVRGIGRALTWRRREQVAAWTAVAESRGGTYTPEVRRPFFLGFGWRPPAIDVEVREVAVHVDVHIEQVGQSAQFYTRLRCPFLLGPGPTFKASPRGVLSAVGTALGLSAVDLGDEAFDRLFVVRSPTPEATRTAFSGEARRLMVERLPGESVAARDGLVTMMLHGVVRDRARVDDGVALLAELGAAGSGLLAAVRSVDGAVSVPATGPWDGRTRAGAYLSVRGLTAWLEPRLPPDGVDTLVVVEGSRDLAAFELRVEEGGGLPDGLPAAALPGGAAQLLPPVSPALVRWTGSRAEVVLPGEPSPGRLASAVELAAALALGPAGIGAYR